MQKQTSSAKRAASLSALARRAFPSALALLARALKFCSSASCRLHTRVLLICTAQHSTAQHSTAQHSTTVFMLQLRLCCYMHEITMSMPVRVLWKHGFPIADVQHPIRVTAGAETTADCHKMSSMLLLCNNHCRARHVELPQTVEQYSPCAAAAEPLRGMCQHSLICPSEDSC